MKPVQLVMNSFITKPIQTIHNKPLTTVNVVLYYVKSIEEKVNLIMTEFVVYDAMMGSGKTTKVKEYILQNPNERFIYITPFLKESYGVVGINFNIVGDEAVPVFNDLTNDIDYDENNPLSSLRFKYPDRKKGRGSKENSLSHLMNVGYNITSTHQLFTHMSIDSLIGADQYTLVIDESLSVYEETNLVSQKEVTRLLKIGILYLDDDGITVRFNRDKFGDNINLETDKTVDTYYESLAVMCDLSQLLLIDGKTLVWEMSADMLRKFKKVIMCTYMFEGQLFSSYLKKHGIEYEIIKFGKKPSEVKHLFNVLDDKKLNSIGASETALSKSFFEKEPTKSTGRDACKRHLNTVMRKWGAKTDNRIFTCFKKDRSFIADGRYNKNWLAFNCRATNDYGNVENVDYLINVFPSPILVKASKGKETDFDIEIHTLTEMLQFLYRGCLRNDKPMNIYIPSSRMRRILFKWLNSDFEYMKSLNDEVYD